MSFFSTLRHLLTANKSSQPEQRTDTLPSQPTDWQPVPCYIEANPSDYPLISVIATAIATGDNTNRQFVVKRIWQRNPEVLHVTLLASSILANETNSKHLTIQNIYKKIQQSN